MQFVSCVFLILNTLFTMYLAGIKNLTNKKIPSLNCPGVAISKKLAYLDNQKEDNNNLMGCYCAKETTIFALWHLIPHNFKDINPKDNVNHCLIFWVLKYVKEIIMFFISTSAVFINEMVAGFFQYLG